MDLTRSKIKYFVTLQKAMFEGDLKKTGCTKSYIQVPDS
jgi:hypothetical protein